MKIMIDKVINDKVNNRVPLQEYLITNLMKPSPLQHTDS